MLSRTTSGRPVSSWQRERSTDCCSGTPNIGSATPNVKISSKGTPDVTVDCIFVNFLSFLSLSFSFTFSFSFSLDFSLSLSFTFSFFSSLSFSLDSNLNLAFSSFSLSFSFFFSFSFFSFSLSFSFFLSFSVTSLCLTVSSKTFSLSRDFSRFSLLLVGNLNDFVFLDFDGLLVSVSSSGELSPYLTTVTHCVIRHF